MAFCLVSVIVDPFGRLSGESNAHRAKRRSARVQRFSRGVLQILGWTVEVVNQHRLDSHRGLIVANHISFWDVVVLASIAPTRFVTSHEVRDSWGLGWICRLAGCLFVNRQRVMSSDNSVDTLILALAESPSIVIFAEGTSTFGDRILPFRSSLFSAAERTDLPTLPVSLQYRGCALTSVSYAGAQTFFGQLWKSCGQAHTQVHVQVAKPVVDARARGRKQTCIDTREAILGLFNIQNNIQDNGQENGGFQNASATTYAT